MYHHPVKSSNLDEVGYDPHTHTLSVKFRNGGHYEYADVPSQAYLDLIRADSKGKHFHAHVRGQYAHRKVEQQQGHSHANTATGTSAAGAAP
jgi:KTSC domain